VKAIILYGSHRETSSNQQPLRIGNKTYYIRAEVVKADDLGEALDRAKAYLHETVLNTVTYE
jgi:hypothetical protein